VKYLSHSASRSSCDGIIPSHRGTKHCSAPLKLGRLKLEFSAQGTVSEWDKLPFGKT